MNTILNKERFIKHIEGLISELTEANRPEEEIKPYRNLLKILYVEFELMTKQQEEALFDFLLTLLNEWLKRKKEKELKKDEPFNKKANEYLSLGLTVKTSTINSNNKKPKI